MSPVPPQLNLAVLRSPDIERAARFYRALGLDLMLPVVAEGEIFAIVDGDFIADFDTVQQFLAVASHDQNIAEHAEDEALATL